MAKEQAMLASDCPRCGQLNTTFDILAETSSPRDDLWAPLEVFARCRACGAPSTALITQKRSYSGGMSELSGNYINLVYDVVEWVFEVPTRRRPPDHVPDQIKSIFDEAATCAAVGCWNASGTMFRKVLDAATRSKIGTPDSESALKAPNWKTYKDLRLRLDWLFSNSALDKSLEDLSSCIHQDGNDAAHDDTGIDRAESEDLADFTERVLEIIYTLPGQIEDNKRRRDERRAAR